MFVRMMPGAGELLVMLVIFGVVAFWIWMLVDCATNLIVEKVLFRDAFVTNLTSPGGQFRQATSQDFPSLPEPSGDWVIETDGRLVAWGGFLTHYNPPYSDLYMEAAEPARRKGFGSFLLQEIKKKCYEAGLKPAARCNADNPASRRTLEKAGMLPCGHLLLARSSLRTVKRFFGFFLPPP